MRALLLITLAIVLLSLPTGVAHAASPASSLSPPTIAGTARVGETLSVSPGSWAGDPPPTFSYRWQRCDAVTPTSSTLANLDFDPTALAVDPVGNVLVADSFNNEVIKITQSGTKSRLAGTGQAPFGMAFDGAGNLYTANAVSDNVTRITPAGVSTTLGSTGYSPRDITIDTAGNVFTVNDDSTVTRITPSGVSSPFGTTGDIPSGIVLDGAGNAYVSNFSSNNVFKIIPSGPSFAFATAGSGPSEIAIDQAGNLYVPNLNDNTVTKITSTGLSSLFGPTGLTPSDIVLDAAGNAYTANRGSNSVTRITPDGVSTTFGSTGGAPNEIALDSAGNVYTANLESSTVTRIIQTVCSDIEGATSPNYVPVAGDHGKKLRVRVSAFNGIGSPTLAYSAFTTDVSGVAPAGLSRPTITGSPAVGQELTATPGNWTGDPAPTFSYRWHRCDVLAPQSRSLGPTGAGPVAIALDPAGNVFTADENAGTVTRVTAEGVSSTLGKTGSGPYGIALDPAGNVYTADYLSNTVTRIRPDGTSSTFGTTGRGPWGIALDSVGNVYTTNRDADTITRITPAGVSSTFASTGRTPLGIAMDPAGNLYTADFDSNTVTRVTPGGSSSTLGTTGDKPTAVVLDPDGNAYVSNYDGDAVTRITPGGISSTLGTTGSWPSDLALDQAGNVYTANYDSGTVTKITPEGTSTTLTITGTRPFGIALDAAGNVYTSNNGSNNVSKITQTECEEIEGSASSTYLPTAPDFGKRIQVEVAASNGIPPIGRSFSDLTGPVGGRTPVNETPPEVSVRGGGAPAVGRTFEATEGTWLAAPAPTFSYQWKRCDDQGQACQPIPDATESDYDIEDLDRGRRIKVVVTATNSEGSGEVASAATEQVLPRPAPRLSKPAVKGPATVRKGRKANYLVTVKNLASVSTEAVKVSLRGPGVVGNITLGAIPASGSRTTSVTIRPKKAGRIRITTTARSSNADTTRSTKAITVR